MSLPGAYAGSARQWPGAAVRRPSLAAVRGLLTLGAATLLVAGLATSSASLHRSLVAAVIAANLLIITVRSPRSGVFATLLYLPLLAFVRRLLIADAGWTSTDPLLLVAPAVVGILLLQLFVVERRRLITDRASQLVVALLVTAVLEVANPSGGGLVVGAGGLLFIGVPLGWFFIGREVADRRLVRAVLTMVTLFGFVVALYGLAQTEIGFPAWDVNWMNSVSFAVLNVGTASSGATIRAFGTFSAPSEYLAWLAITIVLCVAAFYERRSPFILAVPVLAVALFLGSGRSDVLLAIFAVAVITALRRFSGRRAGLIVVGGLVVMVGLLVALGPLLSSAASSSSNPLVAHEAGGLGNPLSGSSSTLPTHFSAFTNGIEFGITHPQGEGTGATTIAADTLGGGGSAAANPVILNGYAENAHGTDIDVSNIFQGLGLLGGVAYVALLWTLARRLLARYRSTRDPLLLAVIGLELVLTGEWLQGQQYAVSALAWFLIGWATRPTPEPPPSATRSSPDAERVVSG